jgi:5-methylcytosine-specific restriction endonuclease McrA
MLEKPVRATARHNVGPCDECTPTYTSDRCALLGALRGFPMKMTKADWERLKSREWMTPERLALFGRAGQRALRGMGPRFRHPANRGMVRRKRLRLNTRAAGRTGLHAIQWLALLDQSGRVCLKCGSRGRLHKDHIVPVLLGGPDTIENVQPLCHRCNQTKGASVADYRPDRLRRWAESPLAKHLKPFWAAHESRLEFDALGSAGGGSR